MKKITVIFLLVCTTIFAQTADEKQLRSIYDAALTDGMAYNWLDHLSNQIGGRLSGSVEAQQAVDYTKKELEKLGVDRVYLQPVMVPRWVRGLPEYANILSEDGTTTSVPICALGGSVATSALGLKANVIEVKSIKELEELGKEKIEGKIVFFNRPMNPKDIVTFTAYGGCVDQRYSGAAEAGKFGAVGVIVRSVNLRLDDYPHTGSMSYGDTPVKNRIPAAAISTNGAELLATALKLNPNTKFFFKQNCKQYDDVQSYNVIAEIKGSTYPNEIIVVGGHLDSWDLGDGSHDDGAGVVQSMDVLRLIKASGYKPKRTIRAVLFMNEENGLRGGNKYAQVAKSKNENHIFALESDAGGFSPRGFSFDCSTENFEQVESWRNLFKPYLIHLFEKGGSGADVGPLKKDNIVLAGLRPDSQRYFDHHHAANDTFEHVNKRELELGAATMTSLVYLFDKYGIVTSKKIKG
ncbi:MULTISPECIES: M28 family peptidase [Cellulophaga]|uniref:Carboxypeptidase Q n=2 Tax=Cellulophaga TaxID=104264 RepID=F0RG12_CELLC|nr:MULTISPECIES: M28 family peptidase [Cellulophaga]ADY27972.1 peptidase M28 [Cellulophaga lytica DSM 7489]AIM59052.1 peptidase M28 [Cellulophaga lytica]APU08854.1 peptidase M28 [Cellulophaga lytica]EWH14127.1 peptidase M28 [Cellulophaga geojensis KL-A]MDO6854339.1 M20/M25/M40 family metallo-hydrolase [Cellulophaga lytica]